MKFRFEGNHLSWTNELESKIIIEFDAEQIGDVIDRFKEFLAGCGYAEETIKEWIGE